MAFLQVGIPHVKDRRLYCMRIITSTDTYYKFGVASGPSSKERMLQIVSSYFDRFRETPKIKIVRDRKVDGDIVFKYETILHKFFIFYQYKGSTPFSGSTELFCVSEDAAIQAYEAVVEGNIPDFQYCKSEDIIPF